MNQFKNVRRAGVPLVAISTSDAAACIKGCVATLNGKATDCPLLEWNIVEGLKGMNEAGREVFADPDQSDDPRIQQQMTFNPTEMLGTLSAKANVKVGKKLLLENAVIFLHMANRLLEAERVEGLGFITGIWLCRDAFKSNGITLVLLAPMITLPPELKQDIIVLDEPLPNDEELAKVCESIVADADMKPEVFTKDRDKVVSTLRGLSAFAAEQTVAMSLGKSGIDVPELMKLKRAYVSQLPGVEVREDKITFADIAGYDNVKSILTRKIKGKRPPRLCLWWEELEKAFAGSQTDTSGTTQDQIASMLVWLQDRLNEDRLSAIMLVGHAGTGKSAISMAVRNEAQCECLRMDFGGMKDSLVGSSEKRIRSVLKVVDAMAGGHILVIATCNSVTGLPSPLLSRFAMGQYMFDLPQKEEGEALWKLKRKKYGIPESEPNPTDDPLTGREINQCCFLADDLKMPLAKAIKYITPIHTSGAADIEALRNQAHKRFLSATNEGIYMKPTQQVATGRKLSV